MFDLKHAVATAHTITFLTGAGVSTPSGIPDYRSKNGLYATLEDPEYALSIDNLRTHPEDFHRFVTQEMMYPDAQPNIIHTTMAALTAHRGAIVTQNVDGLDQLAGAQHVVNFHGSLQRIYCQLCGQTIDQATYLKSDRHAQDGGIFRPDIVLYGEPIAPKVVNAALTAVAEADLLVVVGTSLRVYPFAGLLDAASPQATIVAINREPIDLPTGVHLIQAEAQAVFAQLAAK